MVIGDLDIVGIAKFPAEADPPLVVDPDAPLAGTIAGKLFEPVAGGHAQEVESRGAVELLQPALGDALHVLRELCGKPPVEKLFSFFAGEWSDHG